VKALKVLALNRTSEADGSASGALLREAFRVRYRVYHDEMGVMAWNDKAELCDEFDFAPSTALFVALDGSAVVGTLRLTLFTEELGLPMLQTFGKALAANFGLNRDTGKERVLAEASRFTVLREYRHGKGFVPSLLTCAMFDRCLEDGVTDLFIVSNPAQQLMYEAAGFRAFAWEKDALTGIVSPAMHAETSGSLEEFIKYLKSRLKKEGLNLAYCRDSLAELGSTQK
jgi:N-acyl-L-homoserine lactone synthetase